MKNLFILVVIAVQLMSCNSKKEQEGNNAVVTDSIKADSTAVKEETVSVYEGLLPCADCSGIETVLKIYQGDGTMESHKFELKSTYKGKSPEKEFVETGNFNTERGLGDDQDGTIYILNWDKPEQDQVYYGYYSRDPKKIYMLDRNKKINKSKLNYSLDLNE